MKHINKETKFIALIIAIVLIGMTFVHYGNWLVQKTINETIENAVLVTSDENTYVLDFYGQEYNYSFD